MATVTKLKAAVNNKNLPILGSDGNLYNYYLGMWENKIEKLGYNPTSFEITALSSFIQYGIDNGWINKISYFMPFIGMQSNPLTGLVPLIDNVADYELAVDSVAEGVFTYSSNKIVSCGNTENSSIKSVALPFASSDIESGAFSVFINLNYDDSMITDSHPSANFISIDNGINQSVLRWGSNNKIGCVFNGTDQVIMATKQESKCQMSAFFGVYHNNSNEIMEKRYALKKGDSSPLLNEMSAIKKDDISISTGDYYLGRNDTNSRYINVPFNIIAVVNPVSFTDTDMYSFSQAVFTLTTALGRDIPTT